MTTTPAGLQQQLNALQLFFKQRQLSVNLAKIKVVTFGSRARCQAVTFNGNEAEHVQSYKYLEFEFHTNKALTYGVSKLDSAANKAMHAVDCRCAFLTPSSAAIFLKAWYYPSLLLLVRFGLLVRGGRVSRATV